MSTREDLYEVLGVSKSANDDEIRKAYRKLCLTHHPDKGGEAEQFQSIQKAYETLSDEKKRARKEQDERNRILLKTIKDSKIPERIKT